MLLEAGFLPLSPWGHPAFRVMLRDLGVEWVLNQSALLLACWMYIQITWLLHRFPGVFLDLRHFKLYTHSDLGSPSLNEEGWGLEAQKSHGRGKRPPT